MHRKPKSFSSLIVISAIIAVAGYAVASFMFDFHDAYLTPSWFAFWTVEVWALAGIKKKKIDKGDE